MRIRQLAQDDLAATWELGRLAFGGSRQKPETQDFTGRIGWGAFDASGRLVAKATDREHRHWFGGRPVPAAGIAGVAVAAPARSGGLARQVLTALLAHARERGAAISTLFDTTPLPYRRLGWEEVGALTRRTLPTLALAHSLHRVPVSEEVSLRPAEPADRPAIAEVYRSVAQASSGLIDRTGPTFHAHNPLDDFDGVTLACAADGRVVGYAAWDREPGYDANGKLSVSDLIGLTPAATTALAHMLASWTSVAPTLELTLPDPDPFFLLASSAGSQLAYRAPWMLRIVDAPAAVAARGWPPLLEASVDLRLDDDVCPWNSGPHRLLLGGGSARLEPGGGGAVRLSMRGFALLYAGAAGPALLRRCGFLDGGDDHTDAVLEAAAAGPAPALLDYF